MKCYYSVYISSLTLSFLIHSKKNLNESFLINEGIGSIFFWRAIILVDVLFGIIIHFKGRVLANEYICISLILALKCCLFFQQQPLRPNLVETSCPNIRMDPKLCPADPDWIAFIHSNDIWISNIVTREERRLTYVHNGNVQFSNSTFLRSTFQMQFVFTYILKLKKAG